MEAIRDIPDAARDHRNLLTGQTDVVAADGLLQTREALAAVCRSHPKSEAERAEGSGTSDMADVNEMLGPDGTLRETESRPTVDGSPSQQTEGTKAPGNTPKKGEPLPLYAVIAATDTQGRCPGPAGHA